MTDFKEIRTRIAPSPTGDWHLGTARTALFTYLFARNQDGKFYLRIEDTDRNRIVEGSLESIEETVKWLGLDPDPYPDGKPYHLQSDNIARYRKVAEQLVAEGKAYYCFATPEELEAMRQEQQANKLAPRYDNRWGFRELPLEEAKKRVDAGEKHVVRQKMPQMGETVVEDIISGKVVFDNQTLDDTILLKADGFPTYHLAHVVDDHDTGISHVIRGGEWLSSAPRHVQLHQDLGWDIPVYAHVPVILGPDKGKLSKRHGAKPVLEYEEDGYLPEAIVNFLLLLGWSSGTDKEFFNFEEMIDSFSLERVHASPAIFDKNRLDWFNANYIRKFTPEDLSERLLNYWQSRDEKWSERKAENPEKFLAVVTALHDRLETLAQLPELAEFFYTSPKEYETTLLSAKGQSLEETKQALEFAYNNLSEESDWSRDGLEQQLRGLADQKGMKPGNLLWPIRAALTGLPASPGTFEVLTILGKEDSLERLKYAIDRLE